MSQYRPPLPESPLCPTQRFPQESSRGTHLGPTPPQQTSLQTWEERLSGLWISTLDLPNSSSHVQYILPSLRAQFPVLLPCSGSIGLGMGNDSQLPRPTLVGRKEGIGGGQTIHCRVAEGEPAHNAPVSRYQNAWEVVKGTDFRKVSQGPEEGLQMARTCSPRPRQNSRAVRKPVWAWSRLSNTASSCSGVRGRSLCRP